MQTVIGAFSDRTQAQRAMQQLVQDGFDSSDIHIEEHDDSGTTGSAQTGGGFQHEEKHGGIAGFFANLFGTDNSQLQNHPHAQTYHEAVRRGHSVLVVDARDDQQAELAVACLHGAGAINVDEQVEQWRKEGWTGGTIAAGAARPTMGKSQPGLKAGLRDQAPVGKEGVLDVVQEELQVGKRTLDKGGVRVVQRVTEKPVREVVRLREERAVVDRRPVDRALQPGELDSSFREGTLEVRESAEEVVVAKTARVVEEVRVGKQVQDREETIEDRVRRKDVDIERIAGGAVERERAVASKTREPLSTDRDPEAGNLSRKNNPSQ
ncbi:MAG: hypothetical protein NVS2B4_15240 [Ramlibacter sp.]